MNIYKTLIEDFTNKYAHEKSLMIDRHLHTFLMEQAVTESYNADVIKKALKKSNLQLLQEIKHTQTQEVHTFKLCRVFAESSINIPKLTFPIDL